MSPPAEQKFDDEPQLLQSLFENISDGVFIRGRDLTTLLYSNSRYNDLFPHPDRILENIHPDDRSDVQKAMERVRRGEIVEVEERLLSGDETRWVWVKVIPLKDELEEVQYIGGIVRDITNRKDQEQKFAAYNQSFPDLGFLLNGEGVIQHVLASPESKNLLYKPVEELLGQSVDRILPSDVAAKLQGAIRKALETNSQHSIEYELEVPQGNRTFEARLQPLRDDRYEEELVTAVVRDRTSQQRKEQKLGRALDELEQALETNRMLMDEMNHRVTNNLQMISSILGLEARRDSQKSKQEVLLDCKNRVQALALIHRQLYENQDPTEPVNLGDYLTQLTDRIVQSMGRTDLEINLESQVPDDLRVPLNSSISLALVVNELVTNALQHGFPDRDEGTINLRVERAGDNNVSIELLDDGVGIPADFKLEEASSLGLRLVHDLVVNQLNGDIQFESSQEGTHVTTRVPL